MIGVNFTEDAVRYIKTLDVENVPDFLHGFLVAHLVLGAFPGESTVTYDGNKLKLEGDK